IYQPSSEAVLEALKKLKDSNKADIISSDPFLHLREIPSSQNSDNEKSSHDDTSTFGSLM
ncbi:8238_t:CDS:2, partial [Funneliformis geosporum]